MNKKDGVILIIDDDEDVLITARMILRNHFKTVKTESSPKTLESNLENINPDVVILDMNFKAGATSGNEGLFWLRKIKTLDPDVHVIMNTAYGDIQLAVECMKEGAIDFLVKPWEKEKLLSTVSTVFQLKQSKKELHKLQSTSKVLANDIHKDKGELLGQSAAMQQVFEGIRKVGATDANVLILGENGTGKELVARAIHHHSARANQPFVKVDLGALTESLFESEMFGHKKGAFTDAKEERMGRFEVANGGTLFLDEVGNIALNLQSKLLSVLQNREVSKVGGHKTIPIDIRLICATNKPLHAMAQEEAFREDLLYRINTVEIELPRLADRHGDLTLLAEHFLKVYAKKYDKALPSVTKATWKKLSDYSWPGNVRELQHAVERAIIMASSDTLGPEDFLIKKTEKPTGIQPSLNVEEMEKQTIIQALKQCKGNLTSASKTLGMGRSTLYRKMSKYGL
ncbi:sigma-54-dependent Fis family transcriptional regulator [Fulvivirga sp. M361]|uniref:sigma-54-dependent transcriptional regulator n=1 Tax=Fulvivirga sp. M361 TaxID=2594266 RepID=UPI00117B862C|nr:sigma-54 dependent transcriptional regulator [Fulvivirga sp. M361]TRX51766.1 sigma-54-dependent Fis family transcriptional regulator [Fulvivirga sp. M361]